jgi:hypothetical protein
MIVYVVSIKLSSVVPQNFISPFPSEITFTACRAKEQEEKTRQFGETICGFDLFYSSFFFLNCD